MYKDFFGWSLENVGKGKVDTKYLIEYINDKKTWEKFVKTENFDLYSKREYDNISDALTFYLTWFVSDDCYDIKMWQQVFVNDEMILEEFIVPKGIVKNNMRNSIDREMKIRMNQAERKVEELQTTNKLYEGFMERMGKQYKDMFNEYVKMEECKMSDINYVRETAKKNNWIKYYSTLRPVSIGIGTQPKKGFMDFVNYDDRTELNGMMIWAELYYDRELTDQELKDYELVKG